MNSAGRRDQGGSSPRLSLYQHNRHLARSGSRRTLTVLVVIFVGLIVLAWGVRNLRSVETNTVGKIQLDGDSNSGHAEDSMHIRQTKPSKVRMGPTTTPKKSARPGKSEQNKGVRVRGISVADVVLGQKRVTSTAPAIGEKRLEGTLDIAIDSQFEGPSSVQDVTNTLGDERISSISLDKPDIEEDEEAGAQDLLAPLPNILSDCESSKSAASKVAIRSSRVCDPKQCRFCNHFPPHSVPDVSEDISAASMEYLRNHVLIAVVTGSFDNFSRLDLALCTWLQLMPSDNLYIVSDRLPTKDLQLEGYDRRGQWMEGAIPQGHHFTKKQSQAVEGYTIGWHKAQYRFMLGIDVLVRRAIGVARESDGGGINGLRWVAADEGAAGEPTGADDGDEVNGAPLPYSFPPMFPKTFNATSEHIKWIAVVDDDTFVNLNALVTYFKRMDTAKTKLPIDNSSSNRVSYDSGRSDPIYLGDHGWGGAGHYFNRAAMYQLQEGLYDRCIVPHMMRGSRASDEALKRCLPHIHMGGGDRSLQKTEVRNKVSELRGLSLTSTPRMRIINDRLFSHCQANFLRGRLLRGDHIASHIKRDLTGALPLQALRARLYYQVVYMANTTCAYKLLMHFGACAYGSSCKLKHCDAAHDTQALVDYESLSLQDRVNDL